MYVERATESPLLSLLLSGRFSYNRRKNMFIVHNLYDGFDAYKIKGSVVEHFRSYQSATPKERNVPLSCIFIEGGSSVALGTTTGRAMILDTEKVSTKQVLQHCGMQPGQLILCAALIPLFTADDGLVQEIVCCRPAVDPLASLTKCDPQAHGNPNSRGYSLIATTASECGANTVIKIWVGPATTEPGEIGELGFLCSFMPLI